MVADAAGKTCSHFNEGRTSGDAAAGCEVNHVGSVLHRCRGCFIRPDVVLYQGVGTPLWRVHGICNRRNHGGRSLPLCKLSVAPAGPVLKRYRGIVTLWVFWVFL